MTTKIRAYEQAIHAVTGATYFDNVIEPFAGTGRASRYLLSEGRTNHAYLNDLTDIPRLTLGEFVEVPSDASPRILDESNNSDIGIHKDKITVSKMDWRAFASSTLSLSGLNLFVFDAPYNNNAVLHNVTRYAQSIENHTSLVFAPASFITPSDINPQDRYFFVGPRQDESVFVFLGA